MRAMGGALLLTLAAAAPLSASTYAVNPTRVVFGPKSSSQLLTIRNESTEVLRFQLTVFAWAQSASGEMQLTPSQDVVAFPTLLVLKPQEERRVRVGLSTTAATLEKSYRIFVEELPPAPADGTKPSEGVRVLTRMGIPVFVQPAKVAAVATLTNLAAQKGSVQFDVKNDGTVHFVVGEVKVRGLNAAGATLFESPLNGWYVLAGGLRTFQTPLPVAQCAALTSLTVEVKIGESVLRESLKATPALCR